MTGGRPFCTQWLTFDSHDVVFFARVWIGKRIAVRVTTGLRVVQAIGEPICHLPRKGEHEQEEQRRTQSGEQPVRDTKCEEGGQSGTEYPRNTAQVPLERDGFGADILSPLGGIVYSPGARRVGAVSLSVKSEGGTILWCSMPKIHRLSGDVATGSI